MSQISKEDRDKAVDRAVESMKDFLTSAFHEGVLEDLGPQVLLVSDTDPTTDVVADKPVVEVLSPHLLRTEDDRVPGVDEFMRTVKDYARIGGVFAAITGMEAWLSTLEKEADRNDLPPSIKDWPRHLRREGLFILVETFSSHQIITAEIKRYEDKAPSLEAWKRADDKATKIKGRMTRILPQNRHN